MTIFVIIAPRKNPELTSAVERAFPKNHLEFEDGQFLVAADNISSNGVKERLGISNGEMGRVIVFSTAGSAGWHRKDLWEWIRLREEGQ